MKKLFAAFAMAALLVGCAGSASTTKSSSPLMQMMMKKNAYIQQGKMAGIGKGVSSDEMVAYNKADQEARVDVARALDARVQAITKKFSESVEVEGKEALAQHFQQASKTSVDTHLNGATLVEMQTEQSEDGMYSVYGVMVLDINLVNTLIESMKATQSGLSEAQVEKVRALAQNAYDEFKDPEPQE